MSYIVAFGIFYIFRVVVFKTKKTSIPDNEKARTFIIRDIILLAKWKEHVHYFKEFRIRSLALVPKLACLFEEPKKGYVEHQV